ncbi:MAG: universal stress protein [Syntrophomonas sp.]
MYQKALVAVDGSPSSLKAVETAYQLMKYGVLEEVTLLCVVHYPMPAIVGEGAIDMNLPAEYFQVLRDGAQQVIEQASKQMESSPNVNWQIESGNPPDVILEVARKGKYDLIIIGNRGLNQFQRLFMGSVSSKVISLAHCPVLLIKS